MATSEKPSCLRFADIGPLPKRMLAAIEGYEDMPVVSLEEAVAPLVDLVPKVERNVVLVKRNCKQPKDGLTIDESASIMLYTYESMPRKNSLYMVLNDTLRSEQRQKLVPWFLYLRLILLALTRLPSMACTIYRGVREDLRKEYPAKSSFIWWAFSSCTSSISVLENEQFFGKTGSRTLFAIECISGKNIKNHSFIPHEDEILLIPAREFIVKGQLDSGNGLNMIQIQEIESEVPLIELPAPITPPIKAATSASTSLKPAVKPKTISKIPQIPSNSTWSQNATTIITGLSDPYGLAVDQDDGTVYVADRGNERIISWNPNTNEKNVIVSDLGWPTDVLIDKETNSIIIADYYNSKRVLRCSLENGKNQVETIIDHIGCFGLTMDNEGSLYVCDHDKHEVRKFPRGEKTGILVAGGNGYGNGNHQLNCPHYIALDDEGSLYVTDFFNHRVMKWKKEAKEGITVAGGNGQGSNNNQLDRPYGIVVDSNGNIYVAEYENHRVTRWRKGEKTGEILVGGKGQGNGMNQLNYPIGLSFDRQNNLYVADNGNYRVQRFSLK